MQEESSKVMYLKDYTVAPYTVGEYHLEFDIFPGKTVVKTTATYTKNPDSGDQNILILHGEEIELVSVLIDGKVLDSSEYQINEHTLILGTGKNLLPDEFILTIENICIPEKNTALEGLYKSNGIYCTQCESHGFRRITYFQDRPDVMADFTVKVMADKATCPVLLSNGNKIDAGDIEGTQRHFSIWKDPFKKPCYLFALVAGNLEYQEDTFVTMNGKEVILRIFTESQNIDKVDFAMEALKRSMKWDEERYGLEYDLDIFMIVAVDDFNSGAMENKGLNIFNSSCILASKETATDKDFIWVEKVIGHEYFHNWTGDRVTCRDWFQLSLKEGLTVYRDHEFTSDLHDRDVARIESVKYLKSFQFREDAGPMAHPVRPASFEEISNFYTATVYEKGSEVIRMYEQILGREGFRKGMDLYFQRHDGEAVTTEDFLAAMRDANTDLLATLGVDLNAIQVWYNQAGTPLVHVEGMYNSQEKTFTLHFQQSCPDTPETPIGEKKPFIIPIKYALFYKSSGEIFQDESLYVLQDKEATLVFEGVEDEIIPSLLRGFSAPVKLHYPYSLSDYDFLVQHETDDFNRFEAFQLSAKKILIASILEGKLLDILDFLELCKSILENPHLSDSFKAETLVLPSEIELADTIGQNINPTLIFEMRRALELQIATFLEAEFVSTYEKAFLECNAMYSIDVISVGQRKIKNLALKYITLASGNNSLAYDQWKQSCNMTDEIGAMASIVLVRNDLRIQALDEFYAKWKHNPQVMEKWFSLQASSPLMGVLDDVKALVEHDLFEITNPNKVRSLFNAFALLNPYNFHREDGAGYQFIADKVLELNDLNPMIASRLVKSMIDWKILEPQRAQLLKAQLERIQSHTLSPDVAEVVRKSLI